VAGESSVSLRKRIAGSERLNDWVATVLAGYVSFCVRTSRWERDGFEALARHLDTGEPAVMVLWHQRLIMAPFLFDMERGKICGLTSSARAGRLAGRIVQKFGFVTVAMSSHQRHVSLSRAVLGHMRQGMSVGIACDGPTGPARQAKTFPLVWARSSGHPVFVTAYAGRRCIRLPTWDRMMLPLPFTRGALLVRPFPHRIPRKLDDAGMEDLRQKLDAALDAVTDEADRRAGRRPGGDRPPHPRSM
jgi:lysophospholipid acyltransferase (LPLAT)-like uncharacterized protein